MIDRYISFHNGNLSKDLLRYQAKVFRKFNLPLEQIQTPLAHGAAIDKFLHLETWDRIILFDADCIVLKWDKQFIDSLGFELFGAVQRASHIPNSKDYVAPCFMILRKDVWEQAGKPSFIPNKSDCAADVTYACIENNIPVNYLNILEVERAEWKLEDGRMFGFGSTYGNQFIEIYHAFESNAQHHSTSNFIKKCQRVLLW